MGISVKAWAFDGEPPPHKVILELECDAGTSLVCISAETFDHPDGFPVQHSQAMQKGWLERRGPLGRMWLCPECSGK